MPLAKSGCTRTVSNSTRPGKDGSPAGGAAVAGHARRASRAVGRAAGPWAAGGAAVQGIAGQGTAIWTSRSLCLSTTITKVSLSRARLYGTAVRRARRRALGARAH